MSNYSLPPILFKALAILCFCCVCHQTTAEEATFPVKRVITDQQGRKLDTMILGINGDKVTLRRNSDGKEFTLELNQLSADDRTFIGNLGAAPSGVTATNSPSNPTQEWIVDNFEEKLISPGSIDQLSLAIGKNGPVIAYADQHNIQFIQRTAEAWDSSVIKKLSGTKKDENISIKLAIAKDNTPHIVYCIGIDLFDLNIAYTTLKDSSWVSSPIKSHTFTLRFADLSITDGKCKLILMRRGSNTDVYECDESSINQVLANGGHFQDALFAQGKVFGISKWLPIKGDSIKRFHFSEIQKLTRDTIINEVIKTFEDGNEKLNYDARVATDHNGSFSTLYSSENELFQATRNGNKEGTGLIEGNWILHDYDRLEFKLKGSIVDYAMGSNGMSYMLYNTSDNQVHIARFTPDGKCLIDNLGKGIAIDLAVDSAGNPHVLFQHHDGVVKYAKSTINPDERPESGKKMTNRDARLTMINTPLREHINHAEKKVVADNRDPIEIEYPTAKTIPGKEGYVLSPYTNKPLDVRGIEKGVLVIDTTYPPSEKKYFHVP